MVMFTAADGDGGSGFVACTAFAWWFVYLV